MISKSLDITVISSFVIEPVLPSLKFWLDKMCRDYKIFIEPFNQVFQSVIKINRDKASDVYVIFLRLEDMYQGRKRENEIGYIEDNVNQLISVLKSVAETTSVRFIVIICPMSPCFSHNQKDFTALELKFREELKNNTNVTIILSRETQAYYKVKKWYNDYTAKAASIPYTSQQFMALGSILARKIFNLFSDPTKVIAIDCDNTLWSGVCAEDGALGIKITKNNKFLQQFLKRQKKQGKLLCLISKNEPKDVLNVFEQNNSMLLKLTDIVALKINWHKKSDNIVSLASELSLGLDSFLFIDDNPVECAEVSSLGHGISVVNLPTNRKWSTILNNIWELDPKRVTDEDKRRNLFYKNNYQRENLRQESTSFFDFIENLNLEINFSKLDTKNIIRAAQLSQRTNQFNLAANRYYEDDLQIMCNVSNILIFTVSARDRFGDYGIIGLLVCNLNYPDEMLNIDGFFLSCRILGRGAEFHVLTFIVKTAEENGLKKVCFNLKRTDRNVPAQQFLENITKNTNLSDGNYVVSVESLKRLQLADILIIAREKSSLQNISGVQEKDKESVPFIDLTVRYANLDTFQKELKESSHTELSHAKHSHSTVQTDLQRIMIQSLEEVLNVSPLGIYDNFFELGVSSLQAMLFLGNLSLKVNLSVGLTDFFQCPSIFQLAKRIEQDCSKKENEVAKNIQLEHMPLSAEEQRMWVLQRVTSDSCAYNVLFAQHLYGDIDLDRLLKVIKCIRKRINVFRVQFSENDEVIFKHLNESKNIDVLDVKSCSSSEIESRISGLFCTVFDLERAPLAKIEVLVINDRHIVFCFLASHIIIDRWGAKILFDLISDLYNNSELSIEDGVSLYNQENFRTNSLNEEELLDFWKKELLNSPETVSLPYDLPVPLTRTYRGRTCTVTLSETNRQKIAAISKGQHCSVFMVMLALFRAFIFRYSNQSDCAIGFPFANRESPAMSRLIGLAINTLVFRMNVNGEETLTELIEKTKLSIIKILSKNQLPFDKLVNALNINRNSAINPLFQVMFVYSQEDDQPILSLSKTISKLINPDVGISKFDLTFFSHYYVGGIDLTFEYSTDLFEESTVKTMLERFVNFIENAVSDPNQLIGKIRMFSSSDYKKFFHEYNRTANNENYDTRIDKLFQKTLKAYPNKIAVIYGGNEFTYADINNRADALARGLLKEQRGLVGIFMSDVLDQAVASLAVLKSGSTYVPLDVSSSGARINSILKSAGVEAVITYKKYSHVFSEYKGKLFFFDTDKLNHLYQVIDNVDNLANGSNLAYVIYTSGTTGIPKGVAIEHKSVANTLLDVNKRFSIGVDDVCLSVSNFHFDLSVYDFYGTWAAGGTVVIPDNKHFRDPRHWINLLVKHKVTIWNSVPALMQMLCDVVEDENLEEDVNGLLKIIMLSGDKIAASLLSRIKNIFPKAKIYSLGGATEAAIWSILYPLNDFEGSIIPYGYPLSNQKIYVLNNFLEPCPENVEGEIYIGGVGLARYYLNNQKENDDHFFIHPVLKERLYRTGDLGKIDKDGLIWITGRIDTQVKIRGYRIELGEINAILMNNPLIQDCITLVKGDNDSEKMIVSYYLSNTCSSTKDLSINLMEYMKQHLPSHMIPSKFIHVDRWPLSANGKVDIKTLLKITSNMKCEKCDNVLTATELSVHRIFENILTIKIKDTTDGFFELGGHSLLIPKVIKAIKEIFGVELSFVDIYEQQSIVNIAKAIDRLKVEKKTCLNFIRLNSNEFVDTLLVGCRDMVDQDDFMTNEKNVCVTRYSLKNIAGLIVPLFFSSVAGTLMVSVDRIILGMYSLNAMNAVSIVVSYTSILLFFLCAITSIAAVFVGQFNGEHQFKKTPIAVWQMIYFSFAVIPLLLLISFFSKKYNFLPDVYIKEGSQYMQILINFGFLHPLFAAISSFFIGRKKTTLVTLTVIAINILNLVLDIIFVFGIDEYIPKMGVQGAGIATVVSNAIGVIFLFFVFLNKENRKRFSTNDYSFNAKIFLDCFKIGLPLAISRSLNVSAQFLIFLFIGYSSDNLATLESITIAFYLMLSCYTECLNKGAEIISSNLIGENRIDEIPKVFRTFMNISFVLSIIIAIPLIFYQDFLFCCLEKLNGDILHLHSDLVFIFYVLYFVILADATTWIISGILTSGGDTLYPATINTILLWGIVVIPTACMYYTNTLNSIREINLCLMSYSILTAIVLFFRYKKGDWKKIIV